MPQISVTRTPSDGAGIIVFEWRVSFKLLLGVIISIKLVMMRIKNELCISSLFCDKLWFSLPCVYMYVTEVPIR